MVEYLDSNENELVAGAFYHLKTIHPTWGYFRRFNGEITSEGAHFDQSNGRPRPAILSHFDTPLYKKVEDPLAILKSTPLDGLDQKIKERITSELDWMETFSKQEEFSKQEKLNSLIPGLSVDPLAYLG
tara:strand:+ start:85 stop:471 length:387 start_codon:yes stop_codon:yes gene_type:complete